MCGVRVRVGGPLGRGQPEADVVGGPTEGADEEQTEVAQQSVDASFPIVHGWLLLLPAEVCRGPVVAP
jgi:hypothetical protein